MILNPIDLDMVREKVDDGTYHSLAEFWSDILWVQHNYRIMCNGNLIHVQDNRLRLLTLLRCLRV